MRMFDKNRVSTEKALKNSSASSVRRSVRCRYSRTRSMTSGIVSG